MERNLIVAGVGGQGILTISQVISAAAMRRGWCIKQAEVHGMSQRGGAVYSHLRLADHEIHSELIPLGECDLVVAMEPLEALRYVHFLRERGAVVSSTVPIMNMQSYPPIESILDRITRYPDHVLLDTVQLARAAGSPLAGNSALLGAASFYLDFEPGELEGVLAEHFERKGPRIAEANVKAFALGRSYALAYADALRRGDPPRKVREWLGSLPPEQIASMKSDPAPGLARARQAMLSPECAGAASQILRVAKSEGRVQLFEHEVYKLMEVAGAIAPPTYLFLQPDQSVTADMLERFPGEKVVLKLVSRDVVHKSDVGAVVFMPRDLESVNREARRLIERHRARGATVEGILVVEFVEHHDTVLGQEMFVGIRASREFGPVIAAGVGGVDTEYLADRMKPGAAVAKALAMETSAEAFLELFQKTAAYDLIAGRARGHRRVVSDGELLRCFRSFLALAQHFCAHTSGGPCLAELEVNPFAFVRQKMVPLDGRARLGEPVKPDRSRPAGQIRRMLEPRSIVIVGVSGKRMNFARIILRNTIECGFPIEHLYVLKPGEEQIDGIRCVSSLEDVEEPIDLLIVAGSSGSILPLMEQVLDSGKVSAVILIPGALGETEGSAAKQRQIREKIRASRAADHGGPVVLGANCLGIRSQPGRYDTFFIPRDKWNPRYDEPCNRTALITQSGGFAICRISNLETVNPALAITIGNQIDLTVSDLMRAVVNRDDIDVIGVYMEGFRDLDGAAFVQTVEEATQAGKTVIFYKAGRTAPGRSAMLGHTASVAGDYEVCQVAVANAGAIVVDTVKEFEQLVELATLHCEKQVSGRRIGVISNAGFEAVAMADAIRGARYELDIATLSPPTLERIRQIVAKHGLAELVTASNPLDLNPMANEDVYEGCIRAMMDDPQVDAVVVSLVPFTPEMMTAPHEFQRPGSLVERIPAVMAAANKPLLMVVDAGPPYDALAHALRKKGVPVLPTCDQAIRSLGRYLCHRTDYPQEIAAVSAGMGDALTALLEDAT